MLPFRFIFECFREDIGRLLLRVAIYKSKSVLLGQELIVQPLHRDIMCSTNVPHRGVLARLYHLDR